MKPIPVDLLKPWVNIQNLQRAMALQEKHTGIHVQAEPRSGKTTLAQAWLTDHIYTDSPSKEHAVLWVAHDTQTAINGFRGVYDDLDKATRRNMQFDCVGAASGICAFTPTLLILDDITTNMEQKHYNSLWRWFWQVIAHRLDPKGCYIFSTSRGSAQGAIVMNALRRGYGESRIPWIHLNYCCSNQMPGQGGYQAGALPEPLEEDMYDGAPTYLLRKGC